MLDFIIRLESTRQTLRKKVREKLRRLFGGDNYFVFAGIIALAFAVGTVVTGGLGLPVIGTAGGLATIGTLTAAVVAFLTIILLPIAFILL